MSEPKPDHFYMAQMASEIACLPFLVWGKKPPDELRDLKNFILKFGDAKEIAEKSEAAKLQRMEQDAAFSRSTWLGALGISLGEDGKPIPSNKPNDGKPSTRTLPPHVRQAPVDSSSVPNAGVSLTSGPQAPQASDSGPTAKPEAQKRPIVVVRGGPSH